MKSGEESTALRNGPFSFSRGGIAPTGGRMAIMLQLPPEAQAAIRAACFTIGDEVGRATTQGFPRFRSHELTALEMQGMHFNLQGGDQAEIDAWWLKVNFVLSVIPAHVCTSATQLAITAITSPPSVCPQCYAEFGFTFGEKLSTRMCPKHAATLRQYTRPTASISF